MTITDKQVSNGNIAVSVVEWEHPDGGEASTLEKTASLLGDLLQVSKEEAQERVSPS